MRTGFDRYLFAQMCREGAEWEALRALIGAPSIAAVRALRVRLHRQGYDCSRPPRDALAIYKKNQQIVQLWKAGKTRREIAGIVKLTPVVIRNRILYLRAKYGAQMVPHRSKYGNKIQAENLNPAAVNKLLLAQIAAIIRHPPALRAKAAKKLGESGYQELAALIRHCPHFYRDVEPSLDDARPFFWQHARDTTTCTLLGRSPLADLVRR